MNWGAFKWKSGTLAVNQNACGAAKVIYERARGILIWQKSNLSAMKTRALFDVDTIRWRALYFFIFCLMLHMKPQWLKNNELEINNIVLMILYIYTKARYCNCLEYIYTIIFFHSIIHSSTDPVLTLLILTIFILLDWISLSLGWYMCSGSFSISCLGG